MKKINKCQWDLIFSFLVQMKSQLQSFYELLRWQSLILIRYRSNLKAMKRKYVFPGFVFIPAAYINTSPFLQSMLTFMLVKLCCYLLSVDVTALTSLMKGQ